MDAATGREVERRRVAPDGSYEFQGLDDGEYLLFAGQDHDRDGLTGVPMRRWGAFGGATDPAPVVVEGALPRSASFDVGYPLKAGPNGTFSEANFLPVGGYLHGFIHDVEDVDIYRVPIPEAGTYTFQTSPTSGACGFLHNVATHLALFDSDGVLILEQGALDPEGLNFCSRITEFLDAGEYFLRVRGAQDAGWYAVHAGGGI